MAESNSTETTSPFAASRLSEEAHQRQEEKNRREQRSKLASFLRGALGILGALIAAYFVVLAVLFLLGWTAAPLPFSSSAISNALVKDNTVNVASFSDEELAAQMMMIVLDAGHSSDFATWTEQGVGAIVLSGNSASLTLSDDIASAQSSAANSVQAFIVSDEESAAPRPLAPTIGALPTASKLSTMDAAQIQKTTADHGANLKDEGVNMVLGPSADLGHPLGAMAKNEVSFSDDYDTVATSVRAWTAGMGTAEVGTTLAHWPGLGSYASVDSVVTSFRSWDDMQKDETAVFSKSMNSDVKMIQVGHVIVPELTEQQTPTSISKNAMNYLRSDVGNTVIILSDDIEPLVKSGASSTQSGAVIDALVAGADMVIYQPSNRSDVSVINDVAAAIGSGKISRVEAQAKVERIINAKAGMDLSPNAAVF